MGAAPFQEVEAALRRGEPAIIPTDTVYGLGVAVEFAPSPQVLFDLKGRAAAKPVAWLVDSPQALERYGRDLSQEARDLVRQGWPGPLTVVVRASDAVPAAYRSAQGTIGLRMPDHPVTLELIGAVGCPLAVTSANRSGEAPASFARQLDPSLLASVTALLQDGEGKPGRPSAVIDCSNEVPKVLRS